MSRLSTWSTRSSIKRSSTPFYVSVRNSVTEPSNPVVSDAKNLPRVIYDLWCGICDVIADNKDCCDDFGSSVTLAVRSSADGGTARFEVKKARANSGGDGFDDDDDWGDDDDILSKYSNLLTKNAPTAEEAAQAKLTQVPKDDEEVTRISRAWVQSVISEMGVCPFSQSADKAGLPVGGVHYALSRVKAPEEVYREYWKEVDYLVSSEERAVSTTLLMLPEFLIGNCDGYTSFSDTLTQPLEPLGIEKQIQLVFFHPDWVFRDGEVRLAQKSIPTGLVYTQNEETLMDVGAARLRQMLIDRDWSSLKDLRVDRRYNKLGKIAQMLMEHDGEAPEQVRALLEQQLKDLEDRPAPSAPGGAGGAGGGDSASKRIVRIETSNGGDPAGGEMF